MSILSIYYRKVQYKSADTLYWVSIVEFLTCVAPNTTTFVNSRYDSETCVLIVNYSIAECLVGIMIVCLPSISKVLSQHLPPYAEIQDRLSSLYYKTLRGGWKTSQNIPSDACRTMGHSSRESQHHKRQISDDRIELTRFRETTVDASTQR